MSWLGRVYRGQHDLDFRSAWRVGTVISIVFIVISVGSLAIRGLNLGIDFEGGTSWEYQAEQSVAEVRDVLEGFDQGAAKIQIVGGDTVRVQADLENPDEVSEITAALADQAGISDDDINVAVVGPSWGDEITAAAQRALIVFFVVIALYITLRLEWKMAIGALVATVHDILVTVGVYSVFQFEVTPATVIAFLTILGYSLYDTIVVYDRARANAARYVSSNRFTYTAVMNQSMNQVLMRSINTTITSLLPVVSMLLVGSLALGARPLQEFSIALVVGLLVGGYSSLFVAAPVVVMLKEREPRWRDIRSRLEAKEAAGVVVPREAPAERVAVTAGTSDPGSWPMGHPPRPRKGRGRSRRRD